MVQADPEVSVKLSELPQNVEVLDGLPGPLRDVLLCAASETWAREVSVEGSEGCCRLTIEGRVCLNLRMVLFDRVEAVVEAHGSQPWTRVLAKLPTAAVHGIESGLAQGLEEACLEPTVVGLPELVHSRRPVRRFQTGTQVRVVGPKKARCGGGVVRETVWHFKIGRWMYLLAVDGVAHELRFWDDELAHIDGEAMA